MKIRLDFVTNSSSSSFVCLGVSKEDIELSKVVYLNAFENYIKKSWCSLSEDAIKEMSEEDKIEYAKEEMYDDDFYETDLISCGGSDNDYVGLQITTLLDKFKDVKLGEIKKAVAEELNKQFGTNFTEKDIHYYEEGWYDG